MDSCRAAFKYAIGNGIKEMTSVYSAKLSLNELKPFASDRKDTNGSLELNLSGR